MNHEERKEKIEMYGRGYELLISALREVPREAWMFKPSADDWCIHEIIVHMGDSEFDGRLALPQIDCGTREYDHGL